MAGEVTSLTEKTKPAEKSDGDATMRQPADKQKKMATNTAKVDISAEVKKASSPMTLTKKEDFGGASGRIEVEVKEGGAYLTVALTSSFSADLKLGGSKRAEESDSAAGVKREDLSPPADADSSEATAIAKMLFS